MPIAASPGECLEGKIVARFSEDECEGPDGMTIDSDGNLWIALVPNSFHPHDKRNQTAGTELRQDDLGVKIRAASEHPGLAILSLFCRGEYVQGKEQFYWIQL